MLLTGSSVSTSRSSLALSDDSEENIEPRVHVLISDPGAVKLRETVDPVPTAWLLGSSVIGGELAGNQRTHDHLEFSLTSLLT